MDLCITSITIRLQGKREPEKMFASPPTGYLNMLKDPDTPGGWKVEWIPNVQWPRRQLDVDAADEAMEQLAQVKSMLLKVQEVIENPGK